MKNKLSIFFGPPYAGKTTQASLLQTKFGCSYVSWGKVSRDILCEKGPNKKYRNQLATLMREKKPFPRGFVIKILGNEICKSFKHNTKNKKTILDGFPRRISEAKDMVDFLEKTDIVLDTIVRFDINFNVLEKRRGGRLYCQHCGKFYPKQPERQGKWCKIDGNQLSVREDDNRKVFLLRFKKYIEETIDVFNFLKPHTNHAIKVNANQKQKLVFQKIVKEINKRDKVCYS